MGGATFSSHSFKRRRLRVVAIKHADIKIPVGCISGYFTLGDHPNKLVTRGNKATPSLLALRI
jgi:hypothetical protein